MASKQSSFRLIYSKYLSCLSDFQTFSDVLPALVARGLVSEGERNALQQHSDIQRQRRELAEVLAAQGSSKLTEALTLLDQFNLEEPLPVEGQPTAQGPSQSGYRNATVQELGNGFHYRGLNRTAGGLSISHMTAGDHGDEGSRRRERHGWPQQMESFFVLLFTLLHQIAQEVQHASASSLNWLHVDLSVDKIRGFFPQQSIHSVRPTLASPAKLRLSLLLESFSQFCRKYEQLVKDKKSLTSQIQLLEDKLAAIEGQGTRTGKAEDTAGHLPHLPSPSARPCRCKSENDRQMRELESKVYQLRKEVSQLRKSLSRSEDRNKQLVEVTQVWADESSDKDKLLRFQEAEIQELRSTKDLLKKKLARARKQLGLDREREERLEPSEEARDELAVAQELYEKVVAEKDEVQEELKLLKEEKQILILQIDDLRDANEELKDKLGNWQVQARAKEPSVREMSLLSQENRQMKQEIEELRKTVTELSDEVLAYETHMKDLQEAARDDMREEERRRARHQQPPAHRPAKTQTLVTGFHAPQRKVGPPRRSEATPLPNGHVPRGSRDRIETDSRPENPTLSSPPPSPAHKATPKAYPKAPDTDKSTSGPLNKVREKPKTGPSPSPSGPGAPSPRVSDYTQHIRYPNHSGILIQPLEDDDLAVLQSLMEGEGKTTSPPRYVDQTLLLPVPAGKGEGAGDSTGGPQVKDESKRDKGSRYPGAPNQPVAIASGGTHLIPRFNEQTCPHCSRTFLMLGTFEFKAHVASCSSSPLNC